MLEPKPTFSVGQIYKVKEHHHSNQGFIKKGQWVRILAVSKTNSTCCTIKACSNGLIICNTILGI